MLKSLLTSKKLYTGLGIFILLIAGFLLLMNDIVMPAYTNYDEGVTVPDVTKRSLNDAKKLLDDYGLRYEVADRRSHSAYPANYIIDQNPEPQHIVKPHRKIYLTVNTSKRPQVVVPDVTNLSYRNAKIQLQNYGLDVGTVSYESSRFKNSVLRQSIKPGKKVAKGTLIDLAVSDGLGVRMVKIPQIIGLRLAEAQNKLRDAGLRVGDLRFKPSKEYSPNVVLGYTPSNSDSVTIGQTLNLTISERYNVQEEQESGAVIIDSTENAPDDSLNSNNNPQ